MTNNEQFYKDGCLKLINAIYAMAKTLNSEAVRGLDESMRDSAVVAVLCAFVEHTREIAVPILQKMEEEDETLRNDGPTAGDR